MRPTQASDQPNDIADVSLSEVASFGSPRRSEPPLQDA